MAQEQDVFSKYDSPNSGGQQIVYSQPGPMDKINEFTPIIKQNGKKIVVAIVAVIVLYLALDFFVLSNIAFTINVTDSDGIPVPINSISVYSGDSSSPLFSGKNQAVYSVSMKPGSYRIEAKSSDYKTYNKIIEATKESGSIAVKLEKDLSVSIESLVFPTELYLGQETEAQISLTNSGKEAVEAQLVFDGDLKSFGNGISSEPVKIVIAPGQTVTATIKISVPLNITIKDKKNGDKKKATVKIKSINEESSQAFTLYPAPEFEISPKSFTSTINADGQNHFIKDITVKNKSAFPATNVVFSIDAEDSIKSWFSFQPEATIDSLGASGTTQSSRTIKLWATVPVGTPQQNVSPNIEITASGTKLIPVTMVITIKPVKLDFIASASKETINIPKETTGSYKELIGESIKLQNKGVVDIQNIDLSVDAACRDTWISFPQGAHVDAVAQNSTKEVSMRITAPPSAEAKKPVTCQITVLYEDPLDQTQRKQQVVNIFLVPQS